MMPDTIRVLYVDDEPALLEIGKMFLEYGGNFIVDTRTSAIDALSAIPNKDYDAIVSDYQMPGMDGIAFLKAVRASGNTIPFVLFTGRGREEVVIAALNEGADFYLQKGGEPRSQFAELAHKIRQAVQQRRAEASVRDHERREAEIIDFLPDATFAIDMKGTVIAWNRAMEVMTGVKATDILGKGDHEYAIPIYHERRPVLLDLVFHDDPSVAARYPSLKRDGRTLIAEATSPYLFNGRGADIWFTATPLYDTKGQVTGAIESIRDITERRHDEEALQASEAKNRAILHAMPDMLFVNSRGGTYLDFYASDPSLLYVAPETIIGKNIRDVFPKTTADLFLELFNECLSTGQIRTTEYELVIRNKPMIFEARIVPLDDDNVMTLVRDRTREKRTENSLRESEEKYRTIFDTTGAATIIIDKDTTILLANDGFAALSGYPVEELVGKRSWTEFVVKEDLERMRQYHNIRRDEPGRAPSVYEFRFIDRSGTIRYCINNVAMIPGTTLSVASVVDITDRKNAEERDRLAREEWERTFNAVPDLICILDSQHKICRVNTAMAKSLGVTPKEAEGLTCYEVVHGTQSPPDFCPHRQVLLDQQEHTVEVHEDRLGGDYLVTCTPLRDREGQLIGSVHVARDITERKRAEEDREAAMVMLQSALAQSPSGILIADAPDVKIRWANEAALGIRGESDLPLTGIDVSKHAVSWQTYRIDGTPMPPEELPLSRAILKGETVHNEEVIIRHASGEDRYVSANAAPIRNTDGVITSGIVIFHDITNRKKTEEALRESENLYRSVIENIQDVYYRSDRDGNLIMASPSGEVLLGYESVDEIIGRPIAETLYFDPSERAVFLADLEKTGSVSNYEIRLKKKDGTLVYISTNSHYYHDESGAIAGVEGILRDITERKQAEESIRRSEERYRNVVEYAGEAIVVAKGGDRLVYANPAIIRLLQTTPDEILNRPFTDFIHPDDRALVFDRHQLRMRGEDVPEQYDFRLVNRAGETIWVTISPVRISWDGEPATLNFLNDITEKKQAEDSLRESGERFRFLAENMADIVWTLDLDLRTTYVSPSITKVLGFSPEERTRQPLQAMITPGSFRQVMALFAEELQREKEQGTDPDRDIVFETEYYHADGHIVLMENHAKAMRDADGVVIGVYGTSRDITERKLAEQSQRAETARQQAEAVVITRIALSAGLTEGNVPELARELVEAAANALQVERAGIWLFEADGKELVEMDTYTASSGIHSSGSVLQEDEYRNEFDMLRTAKFVDAHDALSDPRVAGYRETYLKPNRITSMLDAGIRVGGRNLGTLCFEHVDQAHVWQVDEITFACQLADQVALAIMQHERRQAAESVRWNEALLTQMTSSVPFGIYIVDNRTDAILYFNERFIEIWNLQQLRDRMARGELTNNGIIPSCIPLITDVPAFAQSCEPLQDEENRSVVEDEIAFTDGRTIRRFSTQIRDANDRYFGRFYLFEDITDEKLAEETARQQTHTLGILNEVITSANRAGDLPSLMDRTLKKTLALLDYDAGGIYLTDHAAGTATVVVSYNLPPEFLEQVGNVSIRQPPYDTLLVKGLPIITEHYEEINPERARATGFCSLASIPLVSGDRIIGALNVVSTRRDVVTEYEREVLISIGKELGTTITRISKEEEAKKSATNLELLFNSIDEMVFILDMSGRILRVNETVLKKLGYSEEELTGRDVLFLHVPERRDEALRIVQGMIAGTIDFCPVPVLTKDGTRIEVETKVTRGWWDNREVLIGVTRDITLRKAAEEALRKSEEMFRQISSVTTDFAFSCLEQPDNGYAIDWLSGAVREITGYTIKELKGQRCWRFLVHDEDLPIFDRYVTGVEPGRSATCELWIRPKDGGTRWLSCHTSCRPDPADPARCRLHGGCRDITERKRAERELTEVRDMLARTSRIARVGGWEKNFLSGVDTWSDITREIHEVGPDFVPTMQNALEFYREGKSRDTITNVVTRAMSTGEPYNVDVELITAKGNLRWVRTTGHAELEDGRCIRLYGTIQDITDQKKAEDALREVNKKLALLSSITRHDITNQLTVIQGYTALLEKSRPDPDTTQKLRKVKTSTDRISAMIQFTKEYENIGVNAPVWQDIRTLADRAAGQVALGTATVEIQIPAGREVYADPLIGRVFSNLMENAVRHGGTITAIRLSARTSREGLVIICEDDGAGIPADEKERIFEQGYGKNTGMGLFLAREILAITGITITETGEPGKGARFEIAVPKGMFRTKRASPAAPEGPP